MASLTRVTTHVLQPLGGMHDSFYEWVLDKPIPRTYGPVK
jgi:hypothetical protein